MTPRHRHTLKSLWARIDFPIRAGLLVAIAASCLLALAIVVAEGAAR